MNLIYTFDLIGTFFFAVSGVLSGSKNRLDPFGILIIGGVAAVGGGTFRDLAMGTLPVFWLQDLNYTFVIVGAYFATIFFFSLWQKLTRALVFFDTLGIALFTIIGLEKALSVGIHPILAIIMGLFTATVGGITRDVLCNEVPIIFRREIYATACLLGASLYVLLYSYLHVNPNIASSIAIVVIAAVRFLSIKKGLTLPNPFARYWE